MKRYKEETWRGGRGGGGGEVRLRKSRSWWEGWKQEKIEAEEGERDGTQSERTRGGVRIRETEVIDERGEEEGEQKGVKRRKKPRGKVGGKGGGGGRGKGLQKGGLLASRGTSLLHHQPTSLR